MDFEKLYSKLPNIIKYNRSILNLSISVSKKLRKLNKKSHIIDSQAKLLELILLNSNFKVSGTLRNTQLLNLELLRFIDNVCNKYEIDYWLTGGTLLGAIRHKGFIPWDDDVDVNFMREDYERFIDILPKEIEKYDFFKHECGLSLLRDNHENYFTDFKSVYDFEGDGDLLIYKKFLFFQIAWMKPYIKIDCFPQEYVREDKLEYFSKHYLFTKYKFNDEIKNGKKRFDNEFNIKKDEIGFTQEKTKFFTDSLDTIDVYPLSIRKTEEVFPLGYVNFEGYNFKCPKNCDHFLKVLFGPNYMKLPDVIETHNVTSFIESQFNSKEEMNEKFEEAINYLKEINDNFE